MSKKSTGYLLMVAAMVMYLVTVLGGGFVGASGNSGDALIIAIIGTAIMLFFFIKAMMAD